MNTNTVPEVFAEVPDVRQYTLYKRIYSTLFMADLLIAFQATEGNDISKFVNNVSFLMLIGEPHYTLFELIDGLRAVHYALTAGVAMFRQNYCN